MGNIKTTFVYNYSNIKPMFSGGYMDRLFDKTIIWQNYLQGDI